MAKIYIRYGALSLDAIDDINPATVLDAGDEAVEALARKLGHALNIERIPHDGSSLAIDVESSSGDAVNVARRLRDRFMAAWQAATDRAIENS